MELGTDALQTAPAMGILCGVAVLAVAAAAAWSNVELRRGTARPGAVRAVTLRADPPSVSSPSSAWASDPIAVIVVSCESAAVIGPCLLSLATAAPQRGVHVWVIDNASADVSAAIAVRHVGADRVRRLENRGFAAGVNAGVVLARGRWIAVLNPDTIVSPGALDRLADVLESHAQAGLVAPRVVDPAGRAVPPVGGFPG